MASMLYVWQLTVLVRCRELQNPSWAVMRGKEQMGKKGGRNGEKQREELSTKDPSDPSTLHPNSHSNPAFTHPHPGPPVIKKLSSVQVSSHWSNIACRSVKWEPEYFEVCVCVFYLTHWLAFAYLSVPTCPLPAVTPPCLCTACLVKIRINYSWALPALCKIAYLQDGISENVQLLFILWSVFSQVSYLGSALG